MLLSVLYFVTLLITSSKSAGVRTFDAKYVKLTIPTYPQYEGFYYNTNDLETTCSSFALVNLGYTGTYFYKLLNKNVWLYVDGAALKENGQPGDTAVSDMWARLILTETDPTSDCNTLNYDLYSIIHFNDFLKWDDLDTGGNSGEFWCTADWPTPDCTVDVDICKYELGQNECSTGAPSKTPTYDPTFEPTYEPTSYPTNEPTLEPTTNPTTSNPTSVPTKTPTKTPSETPTRTPTPAPTYPRVKYKLHQILSTSGCPACNPFDLSITLFIWTDPNGPSYARITLTGPNDRSFMVLFTHYEFQLGGFPFHVWAGSSFFEQLSGKNVSGFIVEPNNLKAGEVVIDKGDTAIYDDWDTAYKQNSTIVEFDTTYKSNTALITFTRTISTSDIDDWQFKFKQLIDEFYICFHISRTAPNDNDFGSSDCGCVTINQEPDDLNSGFEDIKGNFGIRGKFESDPNHALSPPPFTIYFEWDPFLFIYSGYVIKPKDTWLLWGDYDQTNETKSIADSYEWDYATLCDKDGIIQFIAVDMLIKLSNSQLQRISYTSGRTMVQGIDDYGLTHRINFTIDRTGNAGNTFDMDEHVTNWNTVKFLNTREITFNLFYGDNNNFMSSDQSNQIDKYYGAVMVYLDYVTYAPSLAPTMAPSIAPSLAPTQPPSLAPSIAPSIAPTQPPSVAPSIAPSGVPSIAPSIVPSIAPSVAPSIAPTQPPSIAPSIAPSQAPSSAPTPESYLCMTFCFAGSVSVNVTDVESGWLETLNGIISLLPFVDGMCNVVDNSVLDVTVGPIGTICTECCVSIVGFSENKRWVLLKDVNDNILEFRRTLGDNIGDFVANNDENEDEKLITAITYSEADAVVSDYKCNGIPYPRICRQEIITDYFISIGMGNDTTTFDICYSDGTKYFGIGFGDKGMTGDAIIYTTGKDNVDTANVYDYFLKGKGVSLVTKDVTDDIDTNSVMTNIDDGLFCVTFQRDFDTEDPDDHVFSGTEQSINIWYAVGSSLALSQHSGSPNRGYATLDTVPSPEITDIFWCDGDENKCTITDFVDNTDAPGDCDIKKNKPLAVGPFIIAFEIDCKRNILTLNITYSEYNDNWFGFVFSETMFGDAVIWTTGQKQKSRDVGFYAYENKAKHADGSGVIYKPIRNWNNVITERRRRLQGDNTELHIVYETLLSNMKNIDKTVTKIGFRYAIGSSLILDYHTTKSDHFEIDLESGELIVESDDNTLQILHGIIMSLSWSILIAIGIISSAFRFIYGVAPTDKGTLAKWFKVHRTIQFISVILCVIGFILAIYFTLDSESPHFDTLHKQLGLAVVIIAICQPLNALIRGPVAKDGKPKELRRKIWEIVHKLFGYGGWLLAQVVIFLGIQLITGEDISVYNFVHFAWVGVVIIVYFILWIVKCSKFGSKEQSSEEMLKVNQKSIELGKQTSEPTFGTDAVTKQPTFVDEEEDAPITKTISGK